MDPADRTHQLEGERAHDVSEHDVSRHDTGDVLGEDVNEVHLVGRITAAPERRVLPSGDEVVTTRIVVRRPDGGVDALPVQVGPAPPAGQRRGPGMTGRRVLAATERLTVDERVRVVGQLRRRWWDGGGARRSRLEVRATTIQPL